VGLCLFSLDTGFSAVWPSMFFLYFLMGGPGNGAGCHGRIDGNIEKGWHPRPHHSRAVRVTRTLYPAIRREVGIFGDSLINLSVEEDEEPTHTPSPSFCGGLERAPLAPPLDGLGTLGLHFVET